MKSEGNGGGRYQLTARILSRKIIKHFITYSFYLPPFSSYTETAALFGSYARVLWRRRQSRVFYAFLFRVSRSTSLGLIKARVLCWRRCEICLTMSAPLSNYTNFGMIYSLSESSPALIKLSGSISV